MRYAAYLEIDGVEDVPVIVHYTANRFVAGATDGRGGPKLEPDEPAHIEIESVVLLDGQAYEPTAETKRRLEDEIADWLYGLCEQGEEDE